MPCARLLAPLLPLRSAARLAGHPSSHILASFGYSQPCQSAHKIRRVARRRLSPPPACSRVAFTTSSPNGDCGQRPGPAGLPGAIRRRPRNAARRSESPSPVHPTPPPTPALQCFKQQRSGRPRASSRVLCAAAPQQSAREWAAGALLSAAAAATLLLPAAPAFAVSGGGGEWRCIAGWSGWARGPSRLPRGALALAAVGSSAARPPRPSLPARRQWQLPCLPGPVRPGPAQEQVRQGRPAGCQHEVGGAVGASQAGEGGGAAGGCARS